MCRCGQADIQLVQGRCLLINGRRYDFLSVLLLCLSIWSCAGDNIHRSSQKMYTPLIIISEHLRQCLVTSFLFFLCLEIRSL